MNLSRSSMWLHSFQGTFALPQKARLCNPCLRNELSPFSQEGQFYVKSFGKLKFMGSQTDASRKHSVSTRTNFAPLKTVVHAFKTPLSATAVQVRATADDMRLAHTLPLSDNSHSIESLFLRRGAAVQAVQAVQNSSIIGVG
jgi:hypothetical protein